jgi:amino acid adenylation domain-containing protein
MNRTALGAIQNLSSEKREQLRARLIAKGVDLQALPVLRRPPDQRVIPASFAQQRLWFLDQLQPGSPVYNVPATVRLTGPLDAKVLARTLNEVVRRHDVLRTRFALANDMPIQVVAPALDLELPQTDLSALPEAERALRAGELARHEAWVPFDLAAGPLVRAHLLRTSEAEHILLLTVHHIVCDAWSMGVLSREVAALYAAYERGLPSPLPPLQLQYADYAYWQRHWLGDEVLQAQIDYWKRQLADAPALSTLPTDRLRPPVQTHHGATLVVRLPARITAGLHAAAQQAQGTLFMVLAAAFNVLLWRHSGQDDLCIGMPVASRTRPELEPLIGLFVNTLVLRSRVHGGATFMELLQQVKGTTLDAYAHQDAPLEQLVEVLRPQRNPAHSPLFQVALTLQNVPDPTLQAAGVRFETLGQDNTQAKFDLWLNATEDGVEIKAEFEYNTDLFDASTIERLAGHFTRLLDSVAADPRQRIGQLELLDDAERQLLHTFNATKEDVFPAKCCIHTLFEAQVERTPRATALVFDDDALSYAELNARANRLAHHLTALGVHPDTRVAIALPRGIDMVVALLATLKAGGAYLPLDPDYPADRLAYMLGESTPRVLMTGARVRAALGDLPPSLTVLALDAPTRPWETLPAVNPDVRALGLTSAHLAYVIYTSGSTGLPKGVMVQHAQVVRLFEATRAWFDFGAQDVWTLFHSYAFDFSVWELWGALLHGGRLVVVPHLTARSPDKFYELLCDQQVTVLNQTPSAFRQLIAAQADSDRMHHLRCVIFGGEALVPSMLSPWYARNGERTQLVNMYGITETTVHVTYRPLAPEDTQCSGSPIGVRIPDLRVMLLDAHGQPVPMGVPGELCVGGAGVARGYLGRPDLTSERFVPDPFGGPGSRMYKSGDLGRWRADGSIEFLGRNDHQVKVRGFRIELGEIEAALRSHPEVREAVVLAREDIPGDQRLVAYVVGNAAPESLRVHLGSRLPQYMVPAACVSLQALPLTPNGKLDRKALPAPGDTAFGERAYEAPRGELETALTTLWSELLGIGRIGRHDDFFALGGHSLLAVQLISRIRAAFGLEVPLADLFARPTLAGFAQCVEAATASVLPAIVPASRREPVPLSYAQQRLWFLAQFDERAAAAYAIPGGVRLKGSLDGAALHAAMNRIVARHESLRTCFASVDGAPVQVIAPPDMGLALAHADVSCHAEPETELQRLTDEEATAPFDLAHGPLIRARLIRLADDDHALLVTMHHIVSDGWSMGVLVNEFSALYAAYTQGRPDPLPPLPIQYADYAVWQRRWITGEVLQRQLDFWRHHLTGAPALLELPTDRPRPAAQDYAGAAFSFELDAELTAKLKALSQHHGTTLFMTLLAAWAALLARLSGQLDVVIGTPVANRHRAEIEPLIGFFVNTQALRIDLSGSPSVAELLAQVRATALAAQTHQDIPFEQVVEALSPDRSLAHAPLYQVVFVMQNTPRGELQLPGVSLDVVRATTPSATTDLWWSVEEAGERLTCSVIYARALFDAATIERWSRMWRTLARAMCAGDAQPLTQLPLLEPAERDQLVRGFNAADQAQPDGHCVHQLFEAQAARTPNAQALAGPGVTLSYAQLNARANRLAHCLIALGVRPDALVAIALPRGIDMVVALLATLKAGGAYVPLDPEYPAERLGHMLDDCKARWVLTDTAVQARLPASRALMTATVLELDACPAPWDTCPDTNPDAAALRLTPSHLAYVIYTSGSSGRPKGAMVAHAGLCNLALAQIDGFAVTSHSRVLQFASFSFDACISEVLMALCSGAALYVPAPGVLAGSALHDVLRDGRITHATLPPAVLAGLSDEALPGLHTLVMAGEAASQALVQRWATGRRLINAYGPTEATVCATMQPCDPKHAGSPPIGSPLAHTRIYILDAYGQLSPVGVAGELHIAGVQLARGYLRRPDLTAERFVPDPFGAPGARMYKTGDLGRWRADGTIEFLGRNDHQVKIRGFRIELGEIEAALCAHPEVQEAVVLARDDVPGDPRLVAYIVGQAASQVLRQHLGSRLPTYMIPSAYVTLEALPLTPNGKLDRKALPAPDGSAFFAPAHEPPQGGIETGLAQLWRELLGQERIGRHDDFFALGGHSLRAVQLISRIRAALGMDVALSELFAQPTLAGFAQRVAAATARGLPDIVAASRVQALPLSFSQQRLWFLAQLDERAGDAYAIPGGVRLNGSLDVAALQAAMNRIVARHEALRTTFGLVDGAPVQIIAKPEAGLALSHADLSEHADREAELARMAAEEAHAPFDLARGPLVRARLIRLAGDDHALLVTMHHIVSDGWSMGVLVNELSTLYAAFSQGRPDPLPPLPIQYADYAIWQRRWITGEVLQRQLDFWRNHLSDAPALLELPTDRPRPPVQDYSGASLAFELDAELTASLKVLGQRYGTTLFMTLLAAWAALLARLSGQSDVVIGTPVANRHRAEVEPLIGFFVNTQALRVDLSGSPTVAELLAQVRATALAAQAHQDIPFEQVVEALRPQRSLAHTPLYQAMFVLQNAFNGDLQMPGLSLDAVSAPASSATTDLWWSVEEANERLTCTVVYARALFDAATIERWSRMWRTLARAMVARDAQPVGQLPLLEPAERDRLVYGFNATEAAWPSTHGIHALFEAQVARTPEATALVVEGTSLSYQELNACANRLAHHLIALGVRPDLPVAVALPRGIDMVVALLATLKAGGAYVPLDTDYPLERLAYMLSDSAPHVLLTQSSLRARLGNLPMSLAVLALDDPDRPWEALSCANLNPHALRLSSAHLAYVIYTSGSTGMPKGVANTIGGLANRLQWFIRDVLDHQPVTAFKTSIGFVDSVTEVLQTLLAGGTLVVIDHDTARDPQRLAQQIVRQGVNTLVLVPSLLRHLAASQPEVFDSLRTLVCSGERLTSTLAHGIVRAHPQLRLYNLYGSSEVNGEATFTRYTEGALEQSHASLIGRPIASTRVYVLDAERKLVPHGVVGELYVGGQALARGYVNQPPLTAERFVPDPFAEPGARMYRTGDLARWRAGDTLEFVGRNDHQIKIRGFRIELDEIEARLVEHPDVRAAVVVCREDAPGDQRLVAYITGDERLSPEALRAHLTKRLPEYMVPAAYVVLDALPHTANGKLDRRALPAPETDAFGARAYEAPQGETEVLLARLWGELLGIERIGRHDDFFALGGHSLLAVQLASRIRAQLGSEMALREIFAHRTVRDLASRLDAMAPAPTVPTIEPVPRDAPLPLAPVQERLWVVHQMAGLQTSYNMPLALRLQGPLSLAALQGAFDLLLQRHETLRTRFVADADGQPRQVIEPTLKLNISVVQVGREEVPALAAAHAMQTFDLGRAPLLNVQVLRLDEQEHVLLLNIHHIVSDGWSMNVLAHDMQRLYAAQLHGVPVELPVLGAQYADYAHWRVQQDMAAYAAYWAQALQGYEPGFTLPVDRPAQPRPSAARTLALDYPAELCAALSSLCLQHGTTLFTALAAALGVVLQRYTGRHDLCLGTTVAGRDRAELEPLIGFFINIVVLRLDLSGDPSGSELLDRVNGAVLPALEHQALPFEQVLQQLQLSGDSAQELVPVMVRHQNFPDTAGAQWADGLTVELLEGSEQNAVCPLDVQFFGDAQRLRASVQYAADLFDEATVRRLLQHHLQVLQHMVQRPQQPLSSLPLLTVEERQLIEQCNHTALEMDHALSLAALFEQQVQAAPDACACIDEHGSLSYAELNLRASRIAQALRERGVGPEVRVGLYLPRSCDFIAAMLGIFKAGGVYVPLDVNAPPAYLQRLIGDAQPQVLMHGEQPPAAACAGIVLLNVAQAASHESGTNVSVPWQAQQIAMLAYTSGSTGQPKGVMVPHGQLLNLLRSMQTRLPLAPDDVVAQKTMAPFVVSMKELWGALLAGVPQVIVSDALLKDPPGFIAALQRGRVTRLFIVPSHLQAVLDALDDPAALSTLRVCVTAGEPLSLRLRERVQQTLPWVALWNNFGCTELNDIAYCGPERLGGAGQFVPIGWPIDNVQAHVLDERRRELPLGVVGELCVDYPWMARGYWRQPELTAERFVPNPHGEPGSRLYRTGDLVRRLADGSLEYLGREDFDIKIRGQRVDVRQVEAALAACTGVQRAAAAAWHDEHGDAHLVAYVVPRAEQTLQSAALRQQVAAQLPTFMVPALYVFLQALPQTSTGKLDRRSLPAPQGDARPHLPYTPPSTDTERALTGIWSALLNLPAERIGRHDDFFALGGHSLLVARMVSRVEQALQRRLDLRQVFDSPSLREVAETIDVAPQAQRTMIARRARCQDAPMSFAQQNLWFLDRLNPGNPAFNIAAITRLSGEIDLLVMERAFRALVDRHEVLRTTFHDRDGELLQHIGPPGLASVDVIDLTHIEVAAKTATVNAYCRELNHTHFDLSAGPLIRLHVFRMDEAETVLHLVLHHILADSWSMKRIAHELKYLYGMYARGEQPSLPDLPLQYADYAVWQRDSLKGDLPQRQLQYWLHQLQDAPRVLALPTDRPRPAVQTYRGRTITRQIDPRLVISARALARKEQVTLFSLMLAVFKVLLWRYSGQDDIIVGTTVANRSHPSLEHLVGMFANTVALRTVVAPHASFSEWIAIVHHMALDAYSNQDVPFEKVVEALELPRTASHTPLYQVLFSLHNTPELEEASKQEDDPIESRADVASFDIRVDLFEAGDQLHLFWEYNADLFDESTARRMMGQYEHLLRLALDDPHRPVARLPLVNEQERERLLREFNQTAKPPVTSFVHHAFEAQVRRTPDATALVHEGLAITYRQLNQRANRLAHRLITMDVRPNRLVAVAMKRSPDLVVALLATLKAGGAYVPLDIDYPTERLNAMLADCRPSIVLVDEHGAQALVELAGDVPILNIAADAAGRLEADVDPRHEAIGLQSNDLVYVIYTSGSTGTPKAAQVHHEGFSNLMDWLLYDLGPGLSLEQSDNVLIASSHSFDLTQKNIFGPLIVGATLHFAPTPFDPHSIVEQISRDQITYLNMAPSAFHALIDAHNGHQLASVRKVMLGGEPIRIGKLLELPEPRPQFVNNYGPTECSDVVAYHVLQEPLQQYASGVPLGRPIRNTQLYVLDALGEPAWVGTAGELCVSGVGVGHGYLNRPEGTACSFVADPFQHGARMYRTGDRARWNADARLEFLGRSDFQVKVRGLRVEPGEIEATLLRVDGVCEAVVVARRQGEDDSQLIAYVVAHRDHAEVVEPSSLRQALMTRLPSHMIPAAFVVLPSLPLMPNGKLDRKALPAPQAQAFARQQYAAPSTESERTLAAIWSELLDVPLQLIGVHDNFFALGGTSLAAMRAVGLARERGLVIPLTAIFAQPNLQALAESLQRAPLPSEPRRAMRFTDGNGDERPLFCVPPASGVPSAYAALASRLAVAMPVYGLVGPQEHDRPWETFAQAAQELIRQMRTIQPHGPYRLAGWSLGGVLAYEMATQLIAQGETVDYLAIFDAHADVRSLQRMGLNVLSGQHHLLERTTAQEMVPAALCEAATRWSHHIAALETALLEYVPRPISTPIHLFTTEGNRGLPGWPYMGWDAIVAAEQISIAIVPGSHHDMLSPPHVTSLARRVTESLTLGQ